DTIVQQVAVGSLPVSMAYDASTGDVYVTNSGGQNVTVIDGSTDRVVGSIRVGSQPDGITYDSGRGELFVSNSGSDGVSVIDDSTNELVASIAVGYDPQGVAYDNATGDVYVADGHSLNNWSTGTVSVIADSNNSVVANVTLGDDPTAAVYDPTSHVVLVANFLSNNISVIDAATSSVVADPDVGDGPMGLAYDSKNGTVYNTNSDQGTVSILGPRPPSRYTLSLSEEGLPPGTSWSATWRGEIHRSATSATSDLVVNGTYEFTVTNIANYTSDVTNGTLTVLGADAATSILFSRIPQGYAVVFTESGLAPDTIWTVTLNGITQSTIGSTSFGERNGTYGYSVHPVDLYVSDPSSGVLTVDGAGQSVPVVFSVSPPPTYPVTFREIGLPGGSSWNVTLGNSVNGSVGDTIAFEVPNGSVEYTIWNLGGWHASLYSGRLTVNGGAIPPVTISWTRMTYAITITETGLPFGSNWSLGYNGSSQSSTSSSLVLVEPNGTYRLDASTGPAFSAAAGPWQSIPVAGWAVKEVIPFGPSSRGSLLSHPGPAESEVELLVVATGTIVLVIGAAFVARRRTRGPSDRGV
ncbi:MAG: YncE family protein, partial [Thermoplasmata archaeon]|nr:YncE family protein [Thermoplasmata archaeon]